jgi:23S rRNA pseudouridine1911/1915/1917 synthase
MAEIIVSPEAAGQRLDIVMAQSTNMSRTQVQKLIYKKKVLRNGEGAIGKTIVDENDVITFELPEIKTLGSDQPAPVLTILYEDEDVLAIDKPAGLLVHPGNGRIDESTVADFARAHGVEDDDNIRPGIVHRLDRDTSGILLLAKNPAAKTYMQEQFASRTIEKTYALLVRGRVIPESAIIDLPIGRDPRDGSRRTVTSDGRPAQTSYKTLAYYPGYTYLEAQPKTGRTHQLRVHFASTGNPIVGDVVYGNKRDNLELKRQFLHAAKISFTNPKGKRIHLTSELPEDLQLVLKRLEEAV